MPSWEKMAEAFAQACIHEDGSMPVNLMGAYIMPLHYGLVPECQQLYFRKKIARIAFV